MSYIYQIAYLLLIDVIYLNLISIVINPLLLFS